jgi:hypothetical protein
VERWEYRLITPRYPGTFGPALYDFGSQVLVMSGVRAWWVDPPTRQGEPRPGGAQGVDSGARSRTTRPYR